MAGERVCSFCKKPPREVGTLVEGSGTGSGSVLICRVCAQLAIDLIDFEQQGGASGLIAKFRELDEFEALSKDRALTGIEMERRQNVESDLRKLRADS
jgi:hypothetical protein